MQAEEEIIMIDEGWKKIESTGIRPFLARVEVFDTDELDTKPNPSEEFLTTYDTVFQMCIQREPYNYSERLYDNYQVAFTGYFRESFVTALNEAKATSELNFLTEFGRRWEQNQYAVLGMQRMFCYLDRFHVPNNEDLLGMKEFGFSMYKEIVFETFKDDIRTAILKCILAERNGEDQDRTLLRQCVMVFVLLGQELKKQDLNLYKQGFHNDLLKETVEYYKVASERWLQSLSCPEYLQRAEEAIEAELARIKSYLHQSSEEELMKDIRSEILAKHEEQLLQCSTGIVNMLEENKTTDLRRLFDLFNEVDNGLPPIAEAMKKYIIQLGDQFIAESKEEKPAKGQQEKHLLIQNLIGLHDRFLRIVKNEFNSHPEFNKAMKEAFEKFINEEYYTSNYLARYVNDFFRKGGIGQNFKDDELDQQMKHIVMLYGYIRDKDVFETNYQAYLANRLLSDSSASEEIEKKMIGNLKQESGYHWTQKLEDMFRDIQLSKELVKQFNRGHRDLSVQLNVSVCTQGAWPSSNFPKCNTPVDIRDAVERFTGFYEQKHVGRKLHFRWDKGNAEVTVRFNDKTEKILVISTYQMMVLLLFNQSKSPVLTVQQILDQTGIELEELKAGLLSLAHPKLKVLLKRPNKPTVETTDKVRLNFKFNDPRTKITVPMLKIAKHVLKENAETDAQVLVQRKHQVDAAIVRIMKARKTLSHQVLVSDVRNQLQARFDAQPTLIKQRIEALINLEYLERDEENRTIYNYRQ